MKLFVYGTLLKNQRANSKLSRQKFIGPGEISGFSLYKIKWYPGIIPNEGDRVKGEIYELVFEPEKTLEELDAYEGEGSLYRRILTKAVAKDGMEHEVFVYVYNGTVDEKNYLPYEQQPWQK